MRKIQLNYVIDQADETEVTAQPVTSLVFKSGPHCDDRRLPESTSVLLVQLRPPLNFESPSLAPVCRLRRLLRHKHHHLVTALVKVELQAALPTHHGSVDRSPSRTSQGPLGTTSDPLTGGIPLSPETGTQEAGVRDFTTGSPWRFRSRYWRTLQPVLARFAVFDLYLRHGMDRGNFGVTGSAAFR